MDRGHVCCWLLFCELLIGAYEQAIKDTVSGRMVPCDEQRTKEKSRLGGEKPEEIGRQSHIGRPQTEGPRKKHWKDFE